VIAPGKSISGAFPLPGDKSISHRYAMLAALAEGRSEIQDYSPAADCRSTLACLARLGVKWTVEKDRLVIQGAGLRGLKSSWRKLDAGNSGTTMRLLSGILAGQGFATTITGDDSLRRRPMRRVIEPLTQMGASIRAHNGEFAPLEIHGGKLRGIEYTLPVASAQVKSSVLLAGLLAEGETRVTEPVRTRDHTELALVEFGVNVLATGSTVRVRPPVRLAARRLAVPGDLSAAVFFLAAALILPASSVTLLGVGLNPTRAAILDVLAAMGAAPRTSNLSVRAGELVGDVTLAHALLSGGEVRGAQVAQLIDELPMLAALAPYTEQGIEIRDAAELRKKESDRIAALAGNLRRMGAQVEEFPDGLRVAGRTAGKLHGAEIDPHGDHRIAMAFAVAALGAQGESTIRDAKCAAVSFPEFFDVLDAVVKR
jgi:3-phosphoshikimate 1-carboxyvinyltransferase